MGNDMKLWIVRHGETDWNRAHRLRGGRTDLPLNDSGVLVAEKTADGLREEEIRFQRVYSSPLSRAVVTARLISGTNELKLDERLLEYDFGALEGEHIADLAVAVPLAIEHGGESIQALRARVESFLKEVVCDPENEGSNVLISTHGMVLRALLANVKNLEDVFEATAHANCGIAVLDMKDGRISVTAENKLYY